MRLILAILAFLSFESVLKSAPRSPNVIFILADDLGYGDLGCYGQKQIRTPHLDRLAGEGIRFTQAYAGSTVCAPSRAALLTGKHTGRATIRGNRANRSLPETPLSAQESTLGDIFKRAGYDTAVIGKWGVGENGSPGAPNRKGFDLFFGYQTQFAAHDYYPAALWRNSERVELARNTGGRRGTYTHDLFIEEACNWIAARRDRSFFLYLALTIPHANNEERPNGMQVPDAAPYSDEAWPATEKNFAAMITRMDDGVGRLVALLKDLGIERDTLVVFTSDNGPHSEGGHSAEFFDSNGPFRGRKRDLYEGGIRVPLIVRWPGRIPPRVSDQVVAAWDFLPTFAEMLGEAKPEETTGISILPALLKGTRINHPPLYWEFHEGGFSRAVRRGDWKLIFKPGAESRELYDLSRDPAESRNVASEHPRVVRRLESVMTRERKPSELWPVE